MLFRLLEIDFMQFCKKIPLSAGCRKPPRINCIGVKFEFNLSHWYKSCGVLSTSEIKLMTTGPCFQIRLFLHSKPCLFRCLTLRKKFNFKRITKDDSQITPTNDSDLQNSGMQIFPYGKK